MADQDTIAHLEQLIATLRRRLRVLETQRAHYGDGAAPAHILLELEDVARELGQKEADLRRLRPGPVDDHNPYLGLLTFQETDADRFFGRDALVADLVTRAAKTTFLAVLGASGSGKSSVVRAGLIPMLKGGALPGSERWRYAVLRPGARPLDARAAELARLQGGDLDQALRLRTSLAEYGNALLLAAEMLRNGQDDSRLVLVVDQFEELWTLAPAEARSQFVDLLITASSAADTPLLVVLPMRADFVHRAAEHASLAKSIGEHDVIVSPMQATELRAAIARPAQAVGGSFEAGLVDELVEQTLGRAGALPLLEYTLQELWKRRDNGVITWRSYRALGGIEGALAARADTILAEHYKPEQQDDLRRLPLDDLVPAASSVNTVQSLLKPLIDERLLVVTTPTDLASTSADPAQISVVGRQSSVVEVSHEALIRAWPAFGRWIDEARADLRVQLQWKPNGENAELLWSGLRLAQAEAWIERAQPQLNKRDQMFLDASRAQAEAVRQRAERQARRLRALAIGLTGALVVAVIAGVIAVAFAIRSQTQLTVAQSQALAYAADSLRTTSPETALLLAIKALRRDDNFVSAVFSPDGQRILTASVDNTARVWNLSGKELVTLRGHTGTVYHAVFSPDGQRILAASLDTTARLWDLSGKPLATLQGHTGTVYHAVFNPDGRRILTASADGTARQYLVRTEGLLAACRVGRGLTQGEIQRFQVPTPLLFDFSKRQCPPAFENAGSMPTPTSSL